MGKIGGNLLAGGKYTPTICSSNSITCLDLFKEWRI